MQQENGKILAAIVAIFIILCLLPIWVVEFPPLQDYPEHLLRISMLNNFNNPEFNFKENFDLNLIPIPHLLFESFGVTLSAILPINFVGKVFLSIIIILFPLSIFYFFNSISSEKKYLGLLALPFIFNWYFNMGFMNFCISIPLYFFALGFWFKTFNKKTKKEHLVLTIIVLLIYFAHLFTFILTLFSILFLTIIKTKKIKQMVKENIPVIPSLLGLIVYLFYTFNSYKQEMGTLFFPPKERLLYDFVKFGFTSFSILEMVVFFIALLCLVFLLIVKFKGKEIKIDKKSIEQNPFPLLAVVLFALYLILPFQIGNWFAFNLRLSLFILILAITFFNSPKNIKTKRIFFTIVFLMFFLNLGNTLYYYTQINKEIQDLLSGINKIEKNKKILFLKTDCSYCYSTYPLSHFNAFYMAEQGGTTSHIFVGGPYHSFSYKPGKKLPSPHEYHPEDFSYKEHGVYYDYIILWGKNEEIEKEIKKGFELFHRQGKLQLYKRVN